MLWGKDRRRVEHTLGGRLAVANGRGTTYSFPDGFKLAPGETVTLYTDQGSDTESELYWGKPKEVWNDRLDTMIVRYRRGRPPTVVPVSRHGSGGGDRPPGERSIRPGYRPI